MKTIVLTTVVWALIAATSYGQVKAKAAGSAEAQKAIQDFQQRTAEDQAEHKRDLESGQSLFGADKRWKESEFAGTLARKRPPDFKVGDWGSTSDSFRVLSKVSKTECLVLPQYKGSEVMLIRGLDTSKVTDGVQFVLQHPVLIQGTYSYATVAGAQKTVLVLDNSKVDEFVAKKRAEAEAEQTAAGAALIRTWTRSDVTFIGKFLDFKNNQVLLEQKEDQKTIEVPMTDLSKEDQKWVRDELKRRKDARDAFPGQWRIVDEKGKTATIFTLSKSFGAKKSHAPKVTGKWEIVGNEVRITWSDGWKDILRPQDGEMLKIAFGPGTSWTDTPANSQRAVKE